MALRVKLFVFFTIISLSGIIGNTVSAQKIPASDLICGKWMIEQRNLTVEIYRDGKEYRSKIIWFNDSDDKSRPMETRLDTDNPNPKLRTQKVMGSDILKNLVYVPKTNSWENGVIYDAQHGRYWDSAAYINEKGELKVTGYWHFKFIGKTLTFVRTNTAVPPAK